LDNREQIQSLPHSTEGIDFNKLSVILRKNWLWIAALFLIINSFAFLINRYTKNLYESESELKLDIKSNATQLGFKGLVEDPSVNVVSGEIELIQSKLFLSRVLENADLEISFYSVGRVLNDELFGNFPAFIQYEPKPHSLYNTPLTFDETDSQSFTIQIGERGQIVHGKYGQKIMVGDLELVLTRNNKFKKGDEIGYYFIIHSPDMLLSYLASNLTAEPLNYNANTIRVSFKDYNKLKAQAVLNKIDTLYLQYSNEQKNQANKQKIDWLTNELHHIENRMEDYENYFENFTLENKTSDLNEDLKNTITAIVRIDSQRYDLTRRIKETDRLLEGLNTGELVSSVTLRQTLPAYMHKSLDDLQQLQLEQEKLKLSYNEITFAYRQNQKELDNLKAKIHSQLTEYRSEWFGKLQELNQKKNKLESQFAELPDKNTQFSKNQRFYKLYEEFYLTLMQSKSEFEIAQAGTTPDFKILSPASFPQKPISPNNLMIAGIGLVMSIVVNLFFIGILYVLNNKITSIHELEKIAAAPVLGLVPASRYSDETEPHILHHPKSMVSEAIRTLRTNLEFFNPLTSQKVIAISSTVSGEGKSFIAMNLGGVLALSKKKVILIDLDMRKTKTNLPTPVADTTKGVSTILIRKHTWQDCVINTSVENFYYIPSGPHPPNPSELLLNGEFAELLANLKQNYDFIILDTPPVGLVTDGIMAMKRADVSIYIFRAGYSKKDFLFNLQRIININKFSNITTVLNSVPVSGKTYGYGYYEETRRPKLKSLLNL
jgi:tyrosine-protein kinase Etk/Wzc